MKELGVRSQEKSTLLWLLAARLSALPKARAEIGCQNKGGVILTPHS
jgi:hypothetical protein